MGKTSGKVPLPVLVACPVFDRNGAGAGTNPADLASEQTREYLDGLAGQVLEVKYFAHNPHTPDDVPNAHQRGVMNHYEQYRQIERYFLDMPEAEYLLTVESDMVPHPDSLRLLMDCKAEIAFAPYVYRHGVGILNLLEKYPNGKNIGSSLSHNPTLLKRILRRKDRIIDVSGSGFGVTLFTRYAFKRAQMRLRDTTHAYCDWYFVKDAYYAGLTMRAHLDATAGHIEGDEILYPKWHEIRSSNDVRNAQLDV